MPFRKFVQGYKDFYKTYFQSDSNVYDELVRRGQSPETLVIACSDSRADPALITGSQPGDLFVVRNVAAIVPPYRHDTTHHGTSAAIEFAVKSLKVKHIVVLGHSMCGGIMALANREMACQEYEFITQWMDIAAPARDAVEAELGDASETIKQRALEQAVILVSLNNLMTFPWIAAKVRAGELQIHGWYFDLKSGQIFRYKEKTQSFEKLAATLISQSGESESTAAKQDNGEGCC
ncbi:MAG: carbonic anhydrase [Alphaproteobacteria bacterium]